MGHHEHGHEGSDSGNKFGCMKILGIVSAAVFTLTVAPMETRGYMEERSHLPASQRKTGLLPNAWEVTKYMGRDVKYIVSRLLGSAKDTVDEL